MNRSPLMSASIALPRGPFGLLQPPEITLESLDDCSLNYRGTNSQLRRQTNHLHLLHGNCYTLSQQPFPSAPLFYYKSPFHTASSLQPSLSGDIAFAMYGPSGHGYDIPEGSYGEPHLVSPP
jgi:hypothetical protein